MEKPTDLHGKVVFVIGASSGLGKELAKVMASQGAHITIFARREKVLDQARTEILGETQNSKQKVTAIVANMGDASVVRATLAAQPQLPDIVLCVAGGTPYECGYFMDLEPEIFERMMTNNYYTSVYPAQTVMKMWTQNDQTTTIVPTAPKIRKLIFVNSSASLVAAPGYVAYSAAKAAQRSLVDILYLEVMRYLGPKSTYKVQIVFAHNFITPSFIEEQRLKPELTKRIEGTAGDLADIGKTFPCAVKIAPEIVEAIKSGDFAVLDKRLEPQIVWANMMGTSPRRGWGVFDTLLAILMLFMMPHARRRWEKLCKGDALKDKEEQS